MRAREPLAVSDPVTCPEARLHAEAWASVSEVASRNRNLKRVVLVQKLALRKRASAFELPGRLSHRIGFQWHAKVLQ